MDTSLTEKQISNIYMFVGRVLQVNNNVQMFKYVDKNDEEQNAVGVLWLTFDFILDQISVLFISVHPDYRDRWVTGRSTLTVCEMAKQYGISKLKGATEKTEWVKRWGWQVAPAKIIEMEV